MTEEDKAAIAELRIAAKTIEDFHLDSLGLMGLVRIKVSTLRRVCDLAEKAGKDER